MNYAKPTVQWLFLDLNAFFASCEQQEAPALRGKPVIVVQTPTDSAVAIAASYAAKAFGIKTGTIVREARRLCPAVIPVQANPSVPIACLLHAGLFLDDRIFPHALTTAPPSPRFPPSGEFCVVFRGERRVLSPQRCRQFPSQHLGGDRLVGQGRRVFGWSRHLLARPGALDRHDLAATMARSNETLFHDRARRQNWVAQSEDAGHRTGARITAVD
jgi:hypothetical protein